MKPLAAGIQHNAGFILQQPEADPVQGPRLLEPGDMVFCFQTLYYRFLYDCLAIRNTVKLAGKTASGNGKLVL